MKQEEEKRKKMEENKSQSKIPCVKCEKKRKYTKVTTALFQPLYTWKWNYILLLEVL